MPTKPRRPCSVCGCPNLAVEGGRCLKHKREPWAGRRGFEGYKGEYLKVRKQVLIEEPVCPCGAPSVTVDHIVPRSRGGSDARSNLQGRCKACHDKRSKAQAAGSCRKMISWTAFKNLIIGFTRSKLSRH